MPRRSNRRPEDTGAKKHIEGIIQINRRGVGYLPFENHDDIEIQNTDLSGALNSDTVEVALKGLFPRPRGKVVRVIARAKEEFVCTLRQAQGKQSVAVPADPRFYRPIQVAKHEYGEGEKVLVHLISFDGKGDPKGTIIKHLGRAGEHRVEMNAIVLEHGFQTEFPEEAEREARELEERHAQIIEEELGKRNDFRGTPTM